MADLKEVSEVAFALLSGVVRMEPQGLKPVLNMRVGDLTKLSS